MGQKQSSQSLSDSLIIPPGTRLFGLKNLGNTCYMNAIVQILYHCEPFRDKILQYFKDYEEQFRKNDDPDHILQATSILFDKLEKCSREQVISPDIVHKAICAANDMFKGNDHHDAHEVLSLLLNEIHENENGKFISELFEGKLKSETKCLRCEAVAVRSEPFFDLSLEISAHTSVGYCLSSFSKSELLTKSNKYFCDSCQCRQEALRRISIDFLPRILILHLKRFKSSQQGLRKLQDRVCFSSELRAQGRLYHLEGVVAHIGSGTRSGHYVSLVKVPGGNWALLDDDRTSGVGEEWIRNCFHLGYILVYRAFE